MTSQITPGTSAKYDNPINSDISDIPGPLVHVIPLPPAHPAPKTMPAAANSSSACITAQVVPPSFAVRNSGSHFMIPSATDEEGVMGYHESIFIPPYMDPRAVASFPSIRKVSDSLGLDSALKSVLISQFSDAYAIPSSMACIFISIAFSLPLN